MSDQNYSRLFKPQRSNLSIFRELMLFRVKEILLIATVYDAYILEKEGQLFEQIYGEYYQYNISSAPGLTSVFSTEEAVQAIQAKHFDLVIIVTGLNNETPQILSEKIKEIKPNLPILLLINDNALLPQYEAIQDKLVNIKKMFVWNSDTNIFLAMIKYVEDSMNVINDTAKADVRVILLVEDSIRYYSRYLPVLYSVVMREVQRLIGGEDIDARYRVLKMRARPKILLVSTYEEAVLFYEEFKEYLLCVITDVKYPKKSSLHPTAGHDLVKYIHKDRALPVLLQSSDPENRVFAREHDLGFIDKNSRNLSKDLIEFFKISLGFGNFIFKDQFGQNIAEARYMKEFEILIDDVPDESILYHAERNDFSTWFMAKGEIKTALKLKQSSFTDFSSVWEMRLFIKDIIRQRWLEKKRDSISNFSETMFREKSFLMRVANGSVGGKGRGIAFIDSLLQKQEFSSVFHKLRTTIPKTLIVGTDEFDYFFSQFGLEELLDPHKSYQQLREELVGIPLSSLLTQRFQKILENLTGPIAVRSSGLFEDSLSQPFAGIYDTYFLPNANSNMHVRVQQLETAVKMVYASLFSPLARSYFENVHHSIEDEKMAVIIQELVGQNFGSYFYPNISGVAQSRNYYPFSHMKTDDGIALLAVGLGKTVVDGEASYRFCPKYPKMKLMSIKDLLANSQKQFYALDLNNTNVDLLSGADATLVKLNISSAEERKSLDLCASVYDASSFSIKPGLHMQGPRVINFAYILEYLQIPLAETIATSLDLMQKAFGTAVEIEFALDINAEDYRASTFYILQVKPLIRKQDIVNVDITSLNRDSMLLYSEKAMGNGVIEDLFDFIYVDPQSFDKMKTKEIAREIHELNALLKKEQRSYILVGPGRWGSSDPFLGIPVDWAAISETKVIVEAALPGFHVDASLGSHFFHNITSMNIGYFTISNKAEQGAIDYAYLESCKLQNKTTYLRHLRFTKALTVVMDGRKSLGCIGKPGLCFEKSF